jgi:tRNA(Ile)-lysidine synthase
MVDRFIQFILKRKLCRKNDKILVAVSGGVDSIVLLDLLVRNGYKTGVAHCNFGLRGKESDGDALFVKRLALKLKVPFHINKFNTKDLAWEKGISIQMAAREQRYNWFEKIRMKHGYGYIATAHNLNDSVETIVFNFIKGTGLKGMTGIPVKAGKVIRPLLFATREIIEAYARDNNLNFRTDSSNKSVKYRRNFIRQKILPEFEKINPGFFDTIRNTIARLEGARSFLDAWLENNRISFMETRGKDIYLEKDFFIKNKEPVVLYEVLCPYGFNYDQSVDVFENLSSGTGSMFYTESYVLNNDRSHLIVSSREETVEEYIINKGDSMVTTNRFKLKLEYMTKNQEKLDPDPMVGYFDFDKLDFPLELRTWQEGDWFVPLGMKGKKKLSDFMIDKKIPLNLKKRIMVLLSGGSIVWIAGHRVDERFKLQDSTKKILKVTYLKVDD